MRVCDIANDVPRAEDVIFVDTNIWVFQTYEGATLGLSRNREAQIDRYQRYLGRARQVTATLAIFPTVLLEMANVIERYEYEHACREDGVEAWSAGHLLKHYRQREPFRRTVAHAVASAWAETSSRTICFDNTLGADDCFNAGMEAEAAAIGISDAVHLQLVQKHGCSCILSDDIDFVDPAFDVTLLTRNERALSKAAELDVLVRR